MASLKLLEHKLLIKYIQLTLYGVVTVCKSLAICSSLNTHVICDQCTSVT